MIVFVILAVFIAGLMVGRTPEYLGKKIEQKEMKMAALAILILPASILGFSALAAILPVGTGSILNPGPHGLSEILYAYTSANGNNGSAFAGLTVNTPWYKLDTRLRDADWSLRLLDPSHGSGWVAGQKEGRASKPGHLPTTGPLFVGLLLGVILIVGALTYFPSVCSGSDC